MFVHHTRGRVAAPVLPEIPATTGAPDLIAVLEEIERDARRAMQELASGHARTGSSALQKIATKAQDGARWGADPVSGGTGVTPCPAGA